MAAGGRPCSNSQTSPENPHLTDRHTAVQSADHSSDIERSNLPPPSFGLNIEGYNDVDGFGYWFENAAGLDVDTDEMLWPG